MWRGTLSTRSRPSVRRPSRKEDPFSAIGGAVRRPAIVLAFVVALDVALLFAGGGRPAGRVGSGAGGAGRSGRQVRVGLVFDVGGRGDRSFNDLAYAGLERARDELGVEVEYIEPGEGADRESAIRIFAARGFDLVVGVGFIFSQDLTALAREYPRVKFACIDYAPPMKDGQPLPIPQNLVGLKFREEEGSFLVGAVAGLVTRSRVVGFVGGMDMPLIHKFEAGYRAGVTEVCSDCRVLAQYAGSTPVAFKDPVKGAAIARSQLGQRADVLFHASGSTGLGVIRLARERGVWAIGVDADQFEDGLQAGSSTRSAILTSMVKRVDVVVVETIRAVLSGSFQGGIRVFGLADDGVDYVHEGPHGRAIPRPVVARVEALRARVVAGEIHVPQSVP